MEKKKVNITKYNKPFIEQRADPFICRSREGIYYFTGSVPEYDRIVLRSADTIEGLKEAKEEVLWRKHDKGPQGFHIWAPELHYVMGKWHIYYAAGEAENIWKIRPYVLVCDSGNPMKGPWRELGRMQAAEEDEFSFQAFSLDATVFEHRGEWYYVWAEKTGVGKQISNLYLAKMASPNRLATVQVLLTTPDYAWERVDYWVNEGPAVIRKDGKLFLTFSASATGACYCMGMLYIDEDREILDPNNWRKLPDPVLQTDRDKGIYGPGHNSFVKGEDGITDLCIYHARQYEEIEENPLYDPNRHTMIMPVKWNKNGFPYFEYAAGSQWQ